MKKTSLIPLLALPAALLAAQPNFVLILTDDQGYQDLGCFGSPDIRTPHLDALAQSGLRATSFYVSSAVCSPSRAAIQTGKYHRNVNMWNGGKGSGVYRSNTDMGMSAEEITIAEVLKPQGYACGLFGKWHLGTLEKYLPTSQGYDTFFGTPASNDMGLPLNVPFAPDAVWREGMTMEKVKAVAPGEMDPFKGEAPLMRDTHIVEFPAEQTTLTQRYFTEAMSFIGKAQADKKPFYVCITPNMPHTPLRPGKDFAGKSARGAYGDVVEEIDFNVGRLIAYLKENNLLENTLIVFTSDNGPWLSQGKNGGCALPLRNGKRSLYEGGVRVPCVIAYPASIKPKQVTDEILSSIDLLPTFARMAGANPPSGINGIDLSDFLTGKTDKSPRDTFFYYNDSGELVAVRQKEWKTIFDHPALGYAHKVEKNKEDLSKPYPLSLYNLKEDVGETVNRMPAAQP